VDVETTKESPGITLARSTGTKSNLAVRLAPVNRPVRRVAYPERQVGRPYAVRCVAYAVAEMITVLVIDADPWVRLTARRVLGPAGVTLIAVADSSAALARLAAVRADLILCDIDALDPDGAPAINAIVNVDTSAQLPIPEAARYRGHTFLWRKCVGEAVHPQRIADESAPRARRSHARAN
jgi:hypothetical protein